MLKVRGVFLAGLATHPSAEPASLVVKIDPAERQGLLDDAPDTYYLTDYYRPHPVVIVRLSRIDRSSLRDLLAMSLRAIATRADSTHSAGCRSTGRRSCLTAASGITSSTTGVTI